MTKPSSGMAPGPRGTWPRGAWPRWARIRRAWPRWPGWAPRRGELPAGLAATGGLFGAVGASSCCLAPLVLAGMGASGAWAGSFLVLAPYQSTFAVVSVVFLAAGFWMAYRRPRGAGAGDAEGAAGAPRSGRIVKIGLWVALALLTAALATTYLRPLIQS